MADNTEGDGCPIGDIHSGDDDLDDDRGDDLDDDRDDGVVVIGIMISR